MVEYKCTVCKIKTTDKYFMYVLAEWEMGFREIEDYMVCYHCLSKEE